MDRRRTIASSTMGDEDPMPSSSFSPLRRSLSLLKDVPLALSQNDDAAELARRREMHRQSIALPTSPTNARRSLGLSRLAQVPANEMAKRFAECVKLSNENKINENNAFSLDMIDLMAYMVKHRNPNMASFQVASMSLDVSSKIYGYRVDAMYSTITTKFTAKTDKKKKAREVIDENGCAAEEPQKKPTEKKRSNQKILSTVEALRGVVEVHNPESRVVEDGDAQSSDLMYLAMLPHHACQGFYMHPYNDVIVETKANEGDATVREIGEVPLPRIEDFSRTEICPSLGNFQFLRYSVEEEPERAPETVDDDLRFNLDASLQNDEPVENNFPSYFDVEENVETVGRAATGPRENIVDFRDVITSARYEKPVEYSYVPKGMVIHWAGPEYWKCSTTSKTLGNNGVIETCRQEKARKKELVLRYDDELENACAQRFAHGRNIKFLAKTVNNWIEEKVTLPQDVHYDISQASKLYHCSDTILNVHVSRQVDATRLNEGEFNYDYENEHDQSYCPNVATPEPMDYDDHRDGDVADSDSNDRLQTQAFVGDNLVEMPKLTNKLHIPYSQRAKPVDMCQLKKGIWKLLTTRGSENINEENARARKITEPLMFSDVFKKLPQVLSKPNADAVSFPLAFVSLLHLANEETLRLSPMPDSADIVVDQDRIIED